MGYRVGVDVGGTFTDLICVTPDGEVVLDKTPTTLDDQSIGVMNGLAAARRPVRPPALRAVRRARHPRARHHHRRQHDDRDERRADRPARDRGASRRDRDAPRPQGADLGPDVPGTAADRAPPGAHPDPRAHELPRARCCTPLDEDAVRRGVRRLQQLGVQSIAVMFLFSLREPGARATRRRDHPGGVPRRRPRLALARGDGARAGVRAGVDDARERVRGAEDRRVRRPAAGEAARRRLRRAAAHHAVDRRGDAARLRRPPGGVAAGVRPDRRRDGRGAGRGQGRRRGLHRRRHGRHQLRPVPRARRAARDQDRLELALPVLHRPAHGRRAERRRRRRVDRPRAPGRAARRSRERRLRARTGLLRPRRRPARRSPTPTPCSGTSRSTGSPAAA